MKLKIDFNELVDAFGEANVDHHCIIDTKENKIIYINEEIESDASEKLEKMEDERYIALPARLPQNDFAIMEGFVYELGESSFDLAEKFHNVLESRKPFRKFKDILLEYPEIREKWFKYKDNEIRNQTINWLCENNIELENQQLIPAVKINELRGSEDLPKEIKGFGPAACLNCRNEEGLKTRFFLVNVAPENTLIEKETKRIMKEKYGITHYGNFTGGEKELLTASKCPKCGNEDIFWDY